MTIIISGIVYRSADNWMDYVNIEEYMNKPINYLEIGAFYGGNLISVALSYAMHPDSRVHCIDPWEDYAEYSEYKNEQPVIYNTFMQNIIHHGVNNKTIIHRGYSHIELVKFQDEYFDLIYVDGNHEPEYVMEDAVMSFRKLKKGGIMIFDDYGWGGPDLTQRGIDGFLSGYHKRIIFLGIKSSQLFIKKI